MFYITHATDRIKYVKIFQKFQSEICQNFCHIACHPDVTGDWKMHSQAGIRIHDLMLTRWIVYYWASVQTCPNDHYTSTLPFLRFPTPRKSHTQNFSTHHGLFSHGPHVMGERNAWQGWDPIPWTSTHMVDALLLSYCVNLSQWPFQFSHAFLKISYPN